MQDENILNVKVQYPDLSQHTNDMSEDISDDIMVYLHIYLNTVVRTIISVVGIVTNLINMIIFSKLGLNHSISVGLFSLSLTDFLVASIQMASCICYIIGLLCPDMGTVIFYVDFYVIGWMYSAVYEVSCWITSMISLERCYCVVSPFKVKHVFTRHRCITIILTIYVTHISIHAPLYTINRMEWTEIPTRLGNNTTTGTADKTFETNINEELTLLEFIIDLTAGVSMWLFSQAIVIVCAVLMACSLEASSKVRHNINKNSEYNTRKRRYSKHSSTLSNRERRLVKVVLFLAITLTFCNVPKMIALTIYYIFPGVKLDKLHNLSTIVWALTSTCGTLGCCFSFVVYLKLNINFRRLLIQCLISSVRLCSNAGSSNPPHNVLGSVL